MKKVIKLEDLDCANCAAKLERSIAALDGVNSVSVSFLAQKIVADVSEDRAKTLIEDIRGLAKKVDRNINILG